MFFRYFGFTNCVSIFTFCTKFVCLYNNVNSMCDFCMPNKLSRNRTFQDMKDRFSVFQRLLRDECGRTERHLHAPAVPGGRGQPSVQRALLSYREERPGGDTQSRVVSATWQRMPTCRWSGSPPTTSSCRTCCRRTTTASEAVSH